MVKSENLNNHVLLQELTEKTNTIEAQQLQLMEEWETVSLELEEESV